MNGYEALYSSAAWLDVSFRGRILVAGKDRVRLIHAMCSNDIEGLTPGFGSYSFFLNAQGQIQTDSHIYVSSDHLLLDCEPERGKLLLQHLEKFIIMDDVMLNDLTPRSTMIALEGPHVESLAAKIFGKKLPSRSPNSHSASENVQLFRSSISGQPGLWILIERTQKNRLIANLQEAGAVAATKESYQVVRVENQVPRCGSDFDNNLPQETQQLHGFSLTKGCYLGQEIVERINSRGHVNRLLVGIELESDSVPAKGSGILVEGKKVGQLTSPVFSPRAKRVFGFAILRRELALPGTNVQVEGLQGYVRQTNCQKTQDELR